MNKKRGYLTPDFPSGDELITLQLSVPYVPELLMANIVGAITELYEASNFQKNGTMDTEEAAQFYRNVEILMTTFCESLIDCVTNDVDTQTAITGMLAGEGIVPDASTPNAGNEFPLILAKEVSSNCNDEILYGNCLNAVAILNRGVVDLLQLVEVYTNVLEATTMVASKIPVLSFLSSVGEVIDWLITTATEVYNASYTVASQEQIACEIYCLAEPDCLLTIERVLQGYRNATGALAPPAAGDLEEFMTWLITVPQNVSTTTVASFHLAILEIIARAGEFFGIDYTYILNAGSGSTPTTPNCEDCDCDTPSVFLDFQTTLGYTITLGTRTTGWFDGSYCMQGSVYPTNTLRSEIRVVVDPHCWFTSASVEMSQNRHPSSNLVMTIYDDLYNEIAVIYRPPTNTNHVVYTIAGTFTATKFESGFMRVQFALGYGSALPSQYCTAKNFSLS